MPDVRPADSPRSLGFLCAGDPTRIETFSGTHNKMLRYLQDAHGQPITLIGHHSVRYRPIQHKLNRLRLKLKLPPAKSDYDHDAHLAEIEADFARFGTRNVFAPIASGLVSQLDGGDAKIISYSDGTPELMRGYYDHHSTDPEKAKVADEKERKTIARAAAALYSSQWAADSAVNYYGADPAKVHVVPFGANIPSEGMLPADVANRTLEGPLRMLYIGKYWKRKGGDIAVAVTKVLRDRGIESTLHIVGSPPPVELPDYVKYEGFFDKGKAEGRAAFDQLMFNSHFFLLPTRAECFGVSLVEASAYGLPPISTHTGGLPTVVDSGRTGELLPYDAEPGEWADRITALWNDHPRYLEMAQAARHAYETEFNWTTWAQRILKIVDSLD